MMEESILLMWGRNDDGQLGNRTGTSILGSPLRRLSRGRSDEIHNGSPNKNSSSGPPSVSSVVSQRRRSLSASREGFTAVPSPCPAFAGTQVLRVACGSRHTLAVVAGGEAYSWGWGACGQLGHGDDHCSGVPRVIEALRPSDGREGGGVVSDVSAGGIHSAAVLEGGAVYTWGGSSYGQLGVGLEVTARGVETLPHQVMLPLPSCSEDNTAGLSRRSSLTRIVKGNQADVRPTTPLLAKTVACGGMHTAALTEKGVVYCWGRADNGQLGIGAEWVHESSSGVMGVEWPRRVGGLLEGRRTVSIACGGFHTAAVTTDGECFTWGKEDFGILGVESGALLKGGLFLPHPVTLGNPRHGPSSAQDCGSKGEKVVALACGGWHTAVIGERGGLWTCGRGEYGRLGLGDQTSQSLLVPVQLEQPQQPGQQNNTPVGTIVTNNNADVIPTTNANEFFPKERTADGSPKPPLLPSTPPPTPTPMPEDGAAAVRDADRATMVALGGSHSLVLTASGKVFAFGRQEHGRLGTGAEEVAKDDLGAALPIEVPLLQQPGGWRVQSISCGGVHSAAILMRRRQQSFAEEGEWAL